MGLTCTKSTGLHDKVTMPMLHSWLGLSKEREHLNIKIGREYPKELARFGAPRLYIFNTCQNTISEISRYDGKDKEDHEVSVLKFLTARERMYHGDYGRIRFDSEPSDVARCNETGD